MTRLAFCMILTCAVLAGCNTVAGVGEDVTGVAHWGQGMIGGGGY